VKVFGPLTDHFRSKPLKIQTLSLFGVKFLDLHSSVCGSTYQENCIRSVSDYLNACRDAIAHTEVKVFVLGNGGVGKTTMVGHLADIELQTDPASTDGVRLFSTQLVRRLDYPHSVALTIWDFGGQEIYHGTHCLFIEFPSIFLVAYARSHDAPVDPETPLQYWIDLITQSLGREIAVRAPIRIVQTKCDSEDMEDDDPPCKFPASSPTSPRKKFSHVGSLNTTQNARGVPNLREIIEEAVSTLLHQFPFPPFPQKWESVRQELRRIQKCRKVNLGSYPPTMTLTEFRALCGRYECSDQAETVRDALHSTGVIFYRSALFENSIVIDQSWVLEKIYAIFARANYEFRQNVMDKRGKFRRSDLAKYFWNSYSKDEQFLFISYMEQCGICFRAEPAGPMSTINSDGLYIAPDLLPSWSSVSSNYCGMKFDAGVTASFALLHDGISRGFLSCIGRIVGDKADYWRFGCHFRDAHTRSEVIVRTIGDDLRMEARDGEASTLLSVLISALCQLPCGEPPSIKWDENSDAPHLECKSGANPADRLRPEAFPASPEDVKRFKELLSIEGFMPRLQAFYIIGAAIQSGLFSLRAIARQLDNKKLPKGVSASKTHLAEVLKKIANTLEKELNWRVDLIESHGFNSRLTSDGFRIWNLVGIVLQEADSPEDRTWEPLESLLRSKGWSGVVPSQNKAIDK
jgi:internalin A